MKLSTRIVALIVAASALIQVPGMLRGHAISFIVVTINVATLLMIVVLEVERRNIDQLNQEIRRNARFQVPRTVAEQRAQELFLRCLSPEQRRMWEATYRCIVRGSDRRDYELNLGRVYNVTQGRHRYCAALPYGIPAYDSLLAQKLLIETDARAFRDTANRSVV